MSRFKDELTNAVDNRIVTADDQTLRYRTDWTGRWVGETDAVIRPVTVGQIVDAVRVCQQHNMAVVPQGGNTGLVGGAVPFAGSIVLSTEALKSIGELNEDDLTVTVGAGLTLSELRDFACSRGLETGLNIASAESATIGGIASTNAGGARVMRYGSARARITGLRVVTPNGDIVDRRYALTKDNTGLDLLNLYIGAEGTLGIITDVTWQLVRPNTETLVVLFRFPDATTAVAALPTLRTLPGIEALEWARGSDVVRVGQHLGAPLPLRPDGFWIFAEMGNSSLHDSTAHAVDLLTLSEPILSELIETLSLADDDLAVAGSVNEQRALWALRERMTESIAAEGIAIKLDVAVPLQQFAATCDSVDDLVRSVSPDARTAMFGHFSEGNFHISVLPPLGKRRLDEETADKAEDALLAKIIASGGTISAEHGVGRAKQRWLVRQRGATQYGTMHSIKQALDPELILNPGVLFAIPTTQEQHR